MRPTDDDCNDPLGLLGKATGRGFVTTRIFHLTRHRSRTVCKAVTDGDRVLQIHDAETGREGRDDADDADRDRS